MPTSEAGAPTASTDAAWDAAWPQAGLDLGPVGRLQRRPLSDDDTDLLVRWFALAHPELAALPLPLAERDRLLRQQASGRHREHRAAFPAARHWVLQLDHQPVGHVLVDLDADRCLVVELEIETARRGRGLGAAVLGALVAVADAHRVPSRLHVQVGSPAQRLYERLGFRVVPDPSIDVPLDLLMERPCPTSPT